MTIHLSQIHLLCPDELPSGYVKIEVFGVLPSGKWKF